MFADPPVVGNWYRDRNARQPFQVVASDVEADTVELEYFDGTLDEVTTGEWHAMSIEPSEAPQDSTGPFDDVERDDLGFTETDMTPEDWHETLEGSPKAEDEETEAVSEEQAPPLEGALPVPPEANEDPDIRRTGPLSNA